MKCTNCEKEVPDTAKVCGYCGHRPKAVSASRSVSLPVEQVDAYVYQDALLPTKRISSMLAWLLITLGWGLGGYLADLVRRNLMSCSEISETSDLLRCFGISSSVCIFITFVVGGLALNLVINWMGQKVGNNMVLGGWIAGGILSGVLMLWVNLMGLNMLLIFPGFLVGGLLTGMALQKIESKIRPLHLAIITFSWLLGSLPGLIVATFTSEENLPNGWTISIPWSFDLISGMLVGAICGGVTLMILSAVSRIGSQITFSRNLKKIALILMGIGAAYVPVTTLLGVDYTSRSFYLMPIVIIGLMFFSWRYPLIGAPLLFISAFWFVYFILYSIPLFLAGALLLVSGLLGLRQRKNIQA